MIKRKDRKLPILWNRQIIVNILLKLAVIDQLRMQLVCKLWYEEKVPEVMSTFVLR